MNFHKHPTCSINQTLNLILAAFAIFFCFSAIDQYSFAFPKSSEFRSILASNSRARSSQKKKSQIIEVPPFKSLVTDMTGTLTQNQVLKLDRRLTEFQQMHGHQVAILLIDTLKSEAIESFALRVAESWQLGQAGVDNGVLIAISKKERTARLEIGYGLEGNIPDAYAKAIIEDYMFPKFKAGDFAGGLNAALDRIFELARNKGSDAFAKKQQNEKSPWTVLLILLIGTFGVSIFLASMLLKFKKKKRYLRIPFTMIAFASAFACNSWLFGDDGKGTTVFMAFMAAAITLFAEVSLRGGGKGSGGSSRSWTSGSGGFGGGGGGRFGGGGASGRW